MDTLRIASVSFVNARPLTYGFETGAVGDAARVRHAPPSAIPDLLRQGAADVGLIPSIAWAGLPDTVLLPHLCIGAQGQARSVLLVARAPFDRVRRVALDSASRTSAALLRILMADRGRHDIVYEEQPAALPAMLRDHDAALIIGDPALAADLAGLEVLDLGAAWRESTGLPFVFAVWAARSGARLPGGARPFLESRRLGIAAIPAIAREAAPQLGTTPADLESYLDTNLCYTLGPRELEAFALFHRRARALGLTPGDRPPIFLDAPRLDAPPPAPDPARVNQ
jgi:chorismate dehydratase